MAEKLQKAQLGAIMKSSKIIANSAKAAKLEQKLAAGLGAATVGAPLAIAAKIASNKTKTSTNKQGTKTTVYKGDKKTFTKVQTAKGNTYNKVSKNK